MTVESSTSRVSYTGSGTTGPFAVPFYFLENDDLKVIKTTNATGAEEVLTLTTDYTVTGAADPDGGSVTLVATVSSSYSIVIIRDPDRLQSTSYPRNDPFPAASHERALDKITMLVQRMRDLFDRSFRISDGDVSGVDLEITESATTRANKYLGFDSSGNLTLSQSLDIGSVIISEYMETVIDDMDAPAALTTLGVSAFAQTLLDDASASAARATLGLDIGTDVQAYDADTLKADVADVLTAGYAATPYNAGTKSSGTFTPDEANGNFQYYVNGGAHTLAPPTNNCTLVIQITNNGSAGTITTSGFTVVTGATPVTTNGYDFIAYITKINGFSHLQWQALQ